MNTGLQQIALAIVFATGSMAAAADSGGGRAASLAEIQELFDLASQNQPKCHFVADIEMRETPWTAEQIAKEAENIENFIVETSGGRPARRNAATKEFQSNAVARAHSGVRMYHVEEWYSGKHYRADQFDEVAAVGKVKFTPGHYQETYVNLRDPELSPYTSFDAMHHLRSASLTRKTNQFWATRDLWEAKGLEKEVSGPLFLALVDGHSLIGKGGDSLEFAKMDAGKAKDLHDGTDQRWHLTAADDSLENVAVTRFTLKGDYPAFGVVEVSYWIAHQGQRLMCLRATKTNLTEHTYYESRREGFAENGYPRIWEHSFFKEGVLKRGMKVTFKQIDPEAKFDEAEVFLPDFLHYYMVSDVTSGTGVPAKDVFKEVAGP